MCSTEGNSEAPVILRVPRGQETCRSACLPAAHLGSTREDAYAGALDCVPTTHAYRDASYVDLAMGRPIDGQRHDTWYDTATDKGRFKRSASQLRHWVTADGSAGPTGDAGFSAEAGRYHLYVSPACPRAHRTLIFRCLKGTFEHVCARRARTCSEIPKGLETMIDISVVQWLMGEHDWTFEDGPGVVPDSIHGARRLYERYQVPGVRDTVNMRHIKRHFYESHGRINPTRIVPLDPRMDLDAAHGRGHLDVAPLPG